MEEDVLLHGLGINSNNESSCKPIHENMRQIRNMMWRYTARETHAVGVCTHQLWQVPPTLRLKAILCSPKQARHNIMNMSICVLLDSVP